MIAALSRSRGLRIALLFATVGVTVAVVRAFSSGSSFIVATGTLTILQTMLLAPMLLSQFGDHRSVQKAYREGMYRMTVLREIMVSAAQLTAERDIALYEEPLIERGI